METTTSFAPLAGRLAAKAAEIRPVDGAKVSWANFMALFWCAIFEMLILLCETLDARAAAEAARLVAAPASRNGKEGAVPASRAGRQAPSGGTRAPRLALAPEVQAIIPSRAAAPSGTSERLAPTSPRLMWSRDPGPSRAVLAPPWRPCRKTRFSSSVQARLFCFFKVTNIWWLDCGRLVSAITSDRLPWSGCNGRSRGRVLEQGPALPQIRTGRIPRCSLHYDASVAERGLNNAQ